MTVYLAFLAGQDYAMPDKTYNYRMELRRYEVRPLRAAAFVIVNSSRLDNIYAPDFIVDPTRKDTVFAKNFFTVKSINP